MGAGVKSKKKRRSKIILGNGSEEGDIKHVINNSDGIEHCPCGTGCADCYGKINCGCPDCYTPPVELSFAKKKIKELSEEFCFELILQPLISRTAVKVIETDKETAIVSTVQTQLDMPSVLRRPKKERPISCFDHSSNDYIRSRLSLPVMPDFSLQKEKRRERRKVSEYTEKKIKPAKQTRYYCTTCACDVCNGCFTQSCAGHKVQWIGQSSFICQSVHHVF